MAAVHTASVVYCSYEEIYFAIIFVVGKTVKMSLSTIISQKQCLGEQVYTNMIWKSIGVSCEGLRPGVSPSITENISKAEKSGNVLEVGLKEESSQRATKTQRTWSCPHLAPCGSQQLCEACGYIARTLFSTTWHPVHRQDWSILIYFLYRWDQTDQTWSVQSAWCAEDEALEIDYSVSRCEILLLAPSHKRQPNGVWKPWGAVDMPSKTASRSSTSLDDCRRPESIWLNKSVVFQAESVG